MTKDQKLIADLSKGSPEVIHHIYRQYFDSIAKYTLDNKGTIEDARDLFQDAIMIIYQKSQSPDFILNYTLHTYIYTICKNIWLKKLRKKSDKGVSLPDNLELIVEDTFEEEINWRMKEKLYREKFILLDQSCQQVINLFLKGISMEEIARQMGYGSAGYAKKRKYKCKAKLIDMIKSDTKYIELIQL